MALEPRDTPLPHLFVAYFRSNALPLAILDRVNGLASIVSTDGGTSIDSFETNTVYDSPITGKQLYYVLVNYTGNNNTNGTDVNGRRIFNVVIPEDAEICYFYDSGATGTHTGTVAY